MIHSNESGSGSPVSVRRLKASTVPLCRVTGKLERVDIEPGPRNLSAEAEQELYKMRTKAAGAQKSTKA